MDNLLSIFINSMTIYEKYQALSKQYKDLSIDHESLEKWSNTKGLIRSNEVDSFLQLQAYEKSIFSHVIKNTTEYDSIYAAYLKETDYYHSISFILSLIDNDTLPYESNPSLQFLLRPYLTYFRKKMTEYLATYSNQLNIEQILTSSITSLSQKLLESSSKVFVFEINNYKNKHRINGNSEKERYNDILFQLGNKDNLTSLYCKYPVLTRMLSQYTDTFFHNITLLLTNIFKVSSEIMTTFDISPTLKIESITFSPYETHQKGQTVSIIELDGSKKIVYKPRNLNILHAYQTLVDYMNDARQEDLLDMRNPKLLIYDTFTIEEYIEHSPCETLQQVKHYYKRLGQISYLMYLLRGTDMHMENIISCNEYPYFIDLETLFTNTIPFTTLSTATQIAATHLSNNVTATGIIPTNTFFTENGYGVDVSALAGKEQLLSKKILGLVNNGTDQIKYDYINAKLPAAKNLPYLKNSSIEYKDYINAFIEGFEAMGNFIVDHKEYIATNILPLFSSCNIRVLIRNTQNYKNILDLSVHPSYLSSSIKRERLFLNVFSLSMKDQTPCLSEYYDLLDGDVPIFFSKVSDNAIIDSRNHSIHNFFEKSSLQLVQEKLELQTHELITTQIEVIQLNTNTTSSHCTNISIHEQLNSLQPSKESSDFYLDYANEIGSYLYQQGIHSNIDHSHCWLHRSSEKSTKIEIMNGTLYNGMSGLALFFIYLNELSSESNYMDFADELLTNALTLCTTEHSPNVLTGKSSALYTSFIFYKLTNSFQYLNYMSKILETISSGNYENHFDWINGCSSTIQVLLTIYDTIKDPKYLEAIYKLIPQLITKLTTLEEQSIDFGHGVSPLPSLFIRLSHSLEDSNYFTLSKKITDYVCSNATSFKRNHWCHGATGIGLSLLMLGNEDFSSEVAKRMELIDHYITTTNLDSLDILCHGNAGTCDYYLEKYLRHNTANDLSIARSIGVKMKTHSSPLLMKDNHTIPLGLFNGLTGIGYEFLRLYNPKKVPSVLLLN